MTIPCKIRSDTRSEEGRGKAIVSPDMRGVRREGGSSPDMRRRGGKGEGYSLTRHERSEEGRGKAIISPDMRGVRREGGRL